MAQGNTIPIAALVVSIFIGGFTIINTIGSDTEARIERLEDKHNHDIGILNKKHDDDIKAVQESVKDMGNKIYGKLDNIIERTSSIHVDVKVNASKIDSLEREQN